jgi:hypothetical protein
MMEIFGFGAVVCEDYCIVLKCTLIVGSQEGLEPAGDYAFPLDPHYPTRRFCIGHLEI